VAKSAFAHPNSLRRNPGGIQRETAKGGCPKVSLLFYKEKKKQTGGKQKMNQFPVIKGAGYVLVHTPDMIV